jgi:hypothetical protein
MKHLISFEAYHYEHLDQILDKINQSGIESLSKTELEFLTATLMKTIIRCKKIESEEIQKFFTSTDNYFTFKFSHIQEF